MSIGREFPILEFDAVREAIIEPHNLIKRLDIPKCCVITFFREVIEAMEIEKRLMHITDLKSETCDIPVYRARNNGTETGLVLGLIGAPGAAALLEELIAMGFERFVVCGGAGVLRKDIAVGNLIVPCSAVRDEGTSYHYMKPSREVLCNPSAVETITRELDKRKIPYIKAKTWTTDAIYRETRAKAELRSSEGCVTVEMEAAALFAVANFRNVILGQILYGGDDLSGEEWDGREWNSRREVRRSLVELSLEICAVLGNGE